MTRPLRVAFFSEGVDIPASRFRCEQFFPHFERAGVDCTMFHGYGTLYNEMHRRRIAPFYKLVCRAGRAFKTLSAKGYDLLFLQRSAFPFSALPEQLRQATGAKTIFDFDDILHVGANGTSSWLRARTFSASIRGATHVIAGNSHLASLARAPHKTTVIPTVVDTDSYRPASFRERNAPVTIGWMGTSGNIASLRTALPQVLQVLDLRPNARLKIVSNAPVAELNSRKQVEQIQWSRRCELELLQSFDIGLMPLEDTESTRGKCGFKMLQYMSTGAAVVSSAVGANTEIYEGSNAGALVPIKGDWISPLLTLCDDTSARRTAAKAGRRHVEEKYSIRAIGPRYLDLFERISGRELSPTQSPQ